MVLVVLGILAAALSRCMPATVEGSIEGRPRFVDGDSFFIGQTEVRMQGIDAPEGRQTCTREGREWRCGEDAKRKLQGLTGGQPIRCDVHSTDQHGRRLATCLSSNGTNLNAEMVAQGYAVAFGSYEGEERQAKLARRGLWASDFERPQDWRRRNTGGT
jgi:endonuclease YncB( thermonuclease family)